jgi:hypothetical protein
MSVIGDLVAGIFGEILGNAAFYTARLVLGVASFGRIRVQGSVDPYPDEPEFGWHNLIWKWDGKYLWLSYAFAFYFGIFVWVALLSALIYYWRSLG